MGDTLRELAAGRQSTSRGAAALIEAGLPPETDIDELRPGSIVRTLLETLAAEVARLHERLGEVYESAFVETGTGGSLELLVDALGRTAPEPDVILDVELDEGLLFLVVRNLGAQPALDVSCAFDPPFRGLGGERAIDELPLFRRITFLAPGRELRTLLDTSAAYFAREEPTRLQATVSWRTPAGEKRRATIVHDLAIYRELAYVPRGAADA